MPWCFYSFFNDAPTIDASTTIAVDEQDKVDNTLLGSH